MFNNSCIVSLNIRKPSSWYTPTCEGFPGYEERNGGMPWCGRWQLEKQTKQRTLPSLIDRYEKKRIIILK